MLQNQMAYNLWAAAYTHQKAPEFIRLDERIFRTEDN